MLDLQRFWQAVLEQDANALRAFFLPDAHVEWPCSNERFTVEEYIRANCEYPGDWDGELERTVWADELAITAVHVFPRDRSASFHVASFIQMRDGRIASMVEYWGDDGPAPSWRQEMNIGCPIRGDVK